MSNIKTLHPYRMKATPERWVLVLKTRDNGAGVLYVEPPQQPGYLIATATRTEEFLRWYEPHPLKKSATAQAEIRDLMLGGTDDVTSVLGAPKTPAPAAEPVAKVTAREAAKLKKARELGEAVVKGAIPTPPKVTTKAVQRALTPGQAKALEEARAAMEPDTTQNATEAFKGARAKPKVVDAIVKVGAKVVSSTAPKLPPPEKPKPSARELKAAEAAKAKVAKAAADAKAKVAKVKADKAAAVAKAKADKAAAVAKAKADAVAKVKAVAKAKKDKAPTYTPPTPAQLGALRQPPKPSPATKGKANFRFETPMKMICDLIMAGKWTDAEIFTFTWREFGEHAPGLRLGYVARYRHWLREKGFNPPVVRASKNTSPRNRKG
jgi:hypothetical protein